MNVVVNGVAYNEGPVWVTFYVTNFNKNFSLYDSSDNDNFLSIRIYCHYQYGDTRINPYSRKAGSWNGRTDGTGYTEEDPYGEIEPNRIEIGDLLK